MRTELAIAMAWGLGCLAALGATSARAADFCDAPQRADAFAPKPVPVAKNSCHYYQSFEATSATASYGVPCGGYTVAFGPKGALRHPRYLHMTAEWGDAPLTAATCSKAQVAAIAWGFQVPKVPFGKKRVGAAAQGQWEQIETIQSATGHWNTVSKVCYLGLSFTADSSRNYQTVQLDIVATLIEGQAQVRKRAKGSIYAYKHTGKCIKAGGPVRKTK